MQHKDRELFLVELEQIVQEVGCLTGNDLPRTLLRERIETLLDDFLLESQPIAATEATIVLADIRGFTAITESLPPATVSTLLNRYFSTMCCVIHRHGGVVDKFMGDAVMAVFGAPVRRPDDSLRALACAVEMQQAMAELNLEAQARAEPRLYVGIAVNTGLVMAGSFGSRHHSEYTVIGDTVNLVSRMEAFSLRGQILLSASTLAAAREHVHIGATNEVRVKGKSGPLMLYELRAVDYPTRLVAPRVEVRRSPRVRVAFPVLLHRVAAKCVLPFPLTGQALDLGYNGMLIDLPIPLTPATDLTMTLIPDLRTEPIGGIDAKVVRTAPRGERFETSLQFSSIDTPAYTRVKQYVDTLLWGP